MDSMDCVVLKNPSDARKMLKLGYQIIDIKAKKDFPRETVFIFSRSDAFIKDLNSLSK